VPTHPRSPSAGLYTLIIEAGGQSLIPEALCTTYKVGRDRVWSVLVHRCLMAHETTGQIFWSAAELGRHLDLHESRIRLADRVLIDAGLMVKVGKKGRANLYVMVPVLLAQDRDTAGEPAGEPAGDTAGDTAGDPAGIPALSGKGKGKRKGKGNSGHLTTHDIPSHLAGPEPLPCPIHGTSNSDTNCGRCADYRRWVKGQPTWAPPTIEDIYTSLQDTCRHGTPAAGTNPNLCPACRRAPKLVKA